MNCDTCKKELTEEDTHESILCTSCMNKQIRLHCVKCATGIAWYKATSLIKKQHKPFIFMLVVALIIAAIFPFRPVVSIRIAIGLGGMLFVSGALLALFPGTYYFGSWVSDLFGFKLKHINDYDDGAGIGRWFVGFLCYSLFFACYGLGTLFLWLIK